MKRIVIVVVAIAVVAAGTAGIWFLSAPQARADTNSDREVVIVEKGTIASTVKATGQLEAARDATLSFEINGTVAELMVERGDEVRAGDELARLDTDSLELQLAQAEANLAQVEAGSRLEDVASAQSSLESAQANYEQVAAGARDEDIAAAEASLANAQANYDKLLAGSSEEEITVAAANLRTAEIDVQQAQREYDRVAYGDNVGTSPQAAELQRATIAYETALANYGLSVQGATNEDLRASQAQVEQAQANLDKLLNNPTDEDLAMAKAQVDQAQASLDKLLNGPTSEDVRIAELQVEDAKLNLKKATMTAPIGGTVTEVNVAVGERLEVAGVVFLVDLTSLYVDVPVDEIDLPSVVNGQPATITLDALPDQPLSGQVSAIAPAPISDGSSVTSYEVTVDLDKLEEVQETVAVGMTANVTIETDRRENVLVIPDTLIQVDEQIGQTFVEQPGQDGQPVRAEVTLGVRSGDNIEVLSGLEAGDQVLVPAPDASDAADEQGGGLFGGMGDGPPGNNH